MNTFVPRQGWSIFRTSTCGGRELEHPHRGSGAIPLPHHRLPASGSIPGVGTPAFERPHPPCGTEATVSMGLQPIKLGAGGFQISPTQLCVRSSGDLISAC